MYIRKPKHILTYAMFYNIAPSMDLNVFKKRVAEAIQKASQKKNMSDVLSEKMGSNYLDPDKLKQMSKAEMDFYLKSLLLYSDEDDHLNDKNFRTVTLSGNGFEIVSYPLLIKILMDGKAIDVRSYTFEKFERLNKFLSGFDKIESSMDKKIHLILSRRC